MDKNMQEQRGAISNYQLSTRANTFFLVVYLLWAVDKGLFLGESITRYYQGSLVG